MTTGTTADARTIAKRGSAYAQLWRVVDGAVKDAFFRHADYLTPKGERSAHVSIIKRVTGTVLSFAVQAAERQRELADKASGVISSASQGAGVSDVGPVSLPRLRRVVRLNPDLVRRHHMGRARQAALLARLNMTAELGCNVAMLSDSAKAAAKARGSVAPVYGKGEGI